MILKKKKFIHERLKNIYKTIDIFWNDKLDVKRMITLNVNDRMKYFDEIIKPKSPIPVAIQNLYL